MVDIVPASIRNFILMYLYGATSLPESVEDRLREVPEDYTFNVKVGHTEYMNSVGRYARPSQAPIVREFFSGNLDSSLAVTRADGSKSITIGEYVSAHLGSSPSPTFEVSQYFTDPSSYDFTERAFIWGTTYYRVNDDARLVWKDGEGFIEGLEVSADRLRGPSNDDFDFIAGNSLVQFINEKILEPQIDPYGIGRRVSIDFTDSPGIPYLKYTPNDYYTDLSTTNSEQHSVDIVAYLSAADQLLDEIMFSDTVIYYDDDRFIVYGSFDDDVLNENSVAYSTFAPGFTGITVAAGSGNDLVTGTGFRDVVYGGTGNDMIYGLGGNDAIYGRGDNDTIFAGEGDDLIDGGEGADTIDGGAGYDTIDFSSKATQGLNVKVHGGDLGNGNQSMRFDVIGGLPDPTGDYLEKVEKIAGTSFDDRIDSADAVVDVDGGNGNDWLNASLELQSNWNEGYGVTVNGGAGNDTITGGKFANGGAGNDTLDMRGWLSKKGAMPWDPTATILITGDFGHDRILSDQNAVQHQSLGQQRSWGVDLVIFDGSSKDDFDFVFELHSYEGPKEYGYNSIGDLAIINKNTGDSLLIKDYQFSISKYSDGHMEIKQYEGNYAGVNEISMFRFDDGGGDVASVQLGSVAAYANFWGV